MKDENSFDDEKNTKSSENLLKPVQDNADNQQHLTSLLDQYGVNFENADYDDIKRTLDSFGGSSRDSNPVRIDF
jgi:hypothetical protein